MDNITTNDYLLLGSIFIIGFFTGYYTKWLLFGKSIKSYIKTNIVPDIISEFVSTMDERDKRKKKIREEKLKNIKKLNELYVDKNRIPYTDKIVFPNKHNIYFDIYCTKEKLYISLCMNGMILDKSFKNKITKRMFGLRENKDELYIKYNLYSESLNCNRVIKDAIEYIKNYKLSVFPIQCKPNPSYYCSNCKIICEYYHCFNSGNSRFNKGCDSTICKNCYNKKCLCDKKICEECIDKHKLICKKYLAFTLYYCWTSDDKLSVLPFDMIKEICSKII